MFGSWACQYPKNRPVWKDSVPQNVGVVLTHGLPKGHLDDQGRGYPRLLKEISRTRLKLVVFGHITVARGRDQIRYGQVQEAHVESMDGNGGLWNAVSMFFWLIAEYIHKRLARYNTEEVTTLVNAAVVGLTMDQVVQTGTVVNI